MVLGAVHSFHSFDSLASGRCAIAFSPPRSLSRFSPPPSRGSSRLFLHPFYSLTSRRAGLVVSIASPSRPASLPSTSSSFPRLIFRFPQCVLDERYCFLFTLPCSIAFDLCRLVFFLHRLDFVRFLPLCPFPHFFFSTALLSCRLSASLSRCCRKRLVYPPSGNSYMES